MAMIDPRIKKTAASAVDFADGEDAIELAAGYDWQLDDWQGEMLTGWLCRDSDGFLAADICAVVAPRQNGKNGTLYADELFETVILGRKVLHTAHETASATRSFEQMLYFFGDKPADPHARFPELNAMVHHVWRSRGAEAIILYNGAGIWYRARAGSKTGRGGSYDTLVIDEAQELTTQQLAAISPVLTASEDPHTIYLGTPPDLKLQQTAEVFSDVRASALNDAPGMDYREWSIERVEDAKDPDNWIATNPGWYTRVNVKQIRADYKSMKLVTFAQEHCCYWPKAQERAALSSRKWTECATMQVYTPTASDIRAFALKFSPDGAMASIAGCVRSYIGTDDDGKPTWRKARIELIPDYTGSMALGAEYYARWLVRHAKNAVAIVVDGQQGAATAINFLKNNGVMPKRIITPKTRDIIDAASMLQNAVDTGEVEHWHDQPTLDASATGSVRRLIGKNGGWSFGSTSEIDSTPIEAAALAHWAAMTTKVNPAQKVTLL